MAPSSPLRCLATAVVVSTLPVTSVGAQELLELPGAAAGSRAGETVAHVGDVDADGVGDVALGAPSHGVDGRNRGLVTVHSGRSGALLFSLTGEVAGEGFGSSVVGLDDVDADGVPDFAVGAPRAHAKGRNDCGAVRVYSGASGELLTELLGNANHDYFGSALSLTDDLTGDGRGELAVGAPGVDANGSASGQVVVWDLRVRVPLLTLDGAERGEHFGAALGNAGDLDGDGFDDLLVGAPDAPGGGAARAYSPFSGRVLLALEGDADKEGLGQSLDGAGDVDKDRVPDLIVGAPGALKEGRRTGRVRIHSGVDGAVLHEWFGAAPGDALGSSVVGVGDVNRDGYADVAVSAPGYGNEQGSVTVYSGVSGAAVSVHVGEPGERLGTATAVIDDLTGDGARDVLAGRPGAGDAAGGALLVSPVALPDAFLLELGHGCGPWAPSLRAAKTPEMGSELVLGVDAPPSVVIVFAGAFAPSPFELGPGCEVHIDLTAGANPIATYTTAGAGDEELRVPIPDLPGTAGAEVVLQAVVLPAQGGLALTNGLLLVVGT